MGKNSYLCGSFFVLCNLEKRDILLLFLSYSLYYACFFYKGFYFYFFNYSSFSQSSGIEIFKALLWGVRFDLWIVLAFNSIIFLIFLISQERRFKKFIAIYFIVVNASLFLFNIIDIEYFKFT